ncbi:MAG: transposase [Mesorhizobium sp.]|nr:MAG: transposase [Mesorhizobium sp.]
MNVRQELVFDRGFHIAADANALRMAVKERKGANMPPKTSPFLYKARNLIERFFSKPKQFRRTDTLRQAG